MTAITEGCEKISSVGHYILDKTRGPNYGSSNMQEVHDSAYAALSLVVGEGDLGP